MLFGASLFFMDYESEQPQAVAYQGAGSRGKSNASTAAQSGESTSAPSTAKRKIPCKTPENASLCYWTHGRLWIANGNPTYRIWKIGTRRMLGILNGPSHFPPRVEEDTELPEFPAELDRAYEADNRRHKRETGIMWAVPPPVFADFEVCPLEPERKGEMQGVCIESAKHIYIDKEY